MVASSKVLHPEIAKLECYQVLHPWTKSCVRAFLAMYVHSVFGSAGFFTVFYLFQYLTRAFKKKKIPGPKEMLKTHIRSSLLFSSVISTSYIGISCLFRNIFGRFYQYSFVYIPAMLAGWGIINETPRNKEFFSTIFANMALETLFLDAKGTGILQWSLRQQTLVFMVLTSFLSYLYNKTKNAPNYFWFFVPPKVIPGKEKEKKCFHKDGCFRNILDNFAKYFSTGFFLKFLKLLFSNIKRPKVLLSSFAKPKTYTFASFLGLYALIYQTSRCLCYQTLNGFSPAQDLLSGFVSGASYIFEPNISIFNSAVITIIQILTEMGRRNNILPNLPYNEVFFALSCGLLFHAKVFMPRHFSPLMQYIMTSVTHGGSDYIANNYHSLLKNF